MQLLPLLLLLIILGIITYFIIKRSVATITRTPIWLFWLVMMAPAFIWTAWLLIVGEDKPFPVPLLIGPFILCLFLYWWLIQIGKPTPEAKDPASESPTVEKEAEIDKVQPGGSSTPRPITTSEEAILRNCFPWGIYYLQQIDYRPQAILCRGKLRSLPEMAYNTIKDNIERAFGDRFLIIFQESFQGQPFFALVPNPWSQTQPQPHPEADRLTRPWFALGLLLVTLLTTTLVGARLSGHSLEELSNPGALLDGLPYSLSLMTILGVHETSHYIAAVRYKIRTTLPYFIPFPEFLGTFGAFIQMRSPVPNRKALFDVAIAGPLGGFIVTLPIIIWGLSLSKIVPLPENNNLFNFQALDPSFSFLFAVIGKLALGSKLMAGMAIQLHPLAIAGYIGLIVTALNLMPVGQLDGGHIVHAMYGQRTAAIVGQLTRFFLLIRAFERQEFLLWAIVLFLMPILDRPALNDVTELDNKRDFLGWLSLVLLILILLPLPTAVAEWLNL
jgi:membrane-associated protease RseP (regulator of RpoE activity)